MQHLLQIQQRNYKKDLKLKTKQLDMLLKHKKIEEHNLYNYLKYGFPTDKRILFFDDSIENIDETNEHSRRIIPVYLPFTQSFMFKPNMKNHNYDTLCKNYPRNSYLKRISRDTDFVSSNGITNKYFTLLNEEMPSIEQRIYEWVLNTASYKYRYVFFDWDHTLNVYNGLQILDSTPQTLADTLLYALGGKERLKNVRNIMDFLIKYDVKIYILTANPLAHMSKDGFVALLQLLMGKANFTHQQLIYVDVFQEPKYKAIHRIINNTAKKSVKSRTKTLKRKV